MPSSHSVRAKCRILYRPVFRRHGDFTRGPRIVTDQTKTEMKAILAEITSGEFAKEWIAEAKAGYPRFEELRAQDRSLRIEEVGSKLRAMMPWLRRGGGGAPGTGGGPGA